MKEGEVNNQINPLVNQLIRNYTIPSDREKAKVLDIILGKIVTGRNIIQTSFLQARSTLKLAATIAGLAIVFSVMLYAYDRKVYVAEVGDVAFRLPDQSRVVLANGSRIKAHRLFAKRSVNLEGPGYFEVKHGEKFNVTSGKSKVTVLGTRFSVENSDGNLRVECFEGKVKVSVPGKESIVEGGNVLTGFESSASEIGIEPSSGNLPSFARFEKNYQATDIRQVILDMSVFFGVSIIYEGKDSRSFSGNFDTGNCDEAIQILCTSMNLQPKKVSDNTIKIY